MDSPCSLPLVGAAILFSATAVPASAQNYRSDADAYPCARATRLAVVQSDSGFSIRERTERPAAAATPANVRLGNSLAIDSRLFAHTSLVRPEPSHVSQR